MINSPVSEAQFVPSVCPHDCPSACALDVEILPNGDVGRLRGAKDNDYTLGVLCSKVANYRERVHHPERLTQPLKRVGPKGSGQFEPISWDEALDTVAEAFKVAKAEHGAESVWPYYYAGTMGQIQRDGINRLRHAIGASRQAKTICTSIAYAGWMAGVGAMRGADPREVKDSDFIIVWGGNPVATQVNFMKHVAHARRHRNAQLVVIDPIRTGTAKKADWHLAPKPGTDGALATAMIHVLLQEGHAGLDYMAQYTDDPSGLRAAVKECGPEWAETITGIAAADIRRLARHYGQHPRSFIRLGIGFSRSRNGAHNVHAVSCLPAVTGAWQHPGGGALLATSDLFHLDKTEVEGLAYLDSNSRELDMSEIGPILCGEPGPLKQGGAVKAMLIQNTNPMAVAPELAKVHQGFAREDLFVCVHEQFMTETAVMADIVLPATTFLEHDDLYISYGQVHMQASEAVISPIGEARSNHEVINALAERLGVVDRSLAFRSSAAELMDDALSASHYPSRQQLLSDRWLDCAGDFASNHFLNGFPWQDGKFRFRPDWPALGDQEGKMPTWPGHWDCIESTDEARPFRLITPPARRFLNSSFTQSPSSIAGEGRPTVAIHPEDAQAHGIRDNDRVTIGNDRGQVTLHALVSDRTLPGLLEARGVWPGTAQGGIGTNVLISSEPALPSGGAVFHDAAVWLRNNQ